MKMRSRVRDESATHVKFQPPRVFFVFFGRLDFENDGNAALRDEIFQDGGADAVPALGFRDREIFDVAAVSEIPENENRDRRFFRGNAFVEARAAERIAERAEPMFRRAKKKSPRTFSEIRGLLKVAPLQGFEPWSPQ